MKTERLPLNSPRPPWGSAVRARAAPTALSRSARAPWKRGPRAGLAFDAPAGRVSPGRSPATAGSPEGPLEDVYLVASNEFSETESTRKVPPAPQRPPGHLGVWTQERIPLVRPGGPAPAEGGLTTRVVLKGSVLSELQVHKWIRVSRRPQKRKRRETEEVFEKLLPDQLVLLLEHLLEQKTLNPRTLQSLERTYQLSQQDAEVRHRWCELIVKHKYTKAYKDVERFLQEDQGLEDSSCWGATDMLVSRHTALGGVLRLVTCTRYLRSCFQPRMLLWQAMGIYLYGELMVSEDARQQQVARRCFELTKEQMDRSSAQVVAEMLF
nr:uncharacterized protein LOC112908720 [Vulpes vulpes]